MTKPIHIVQLYPKDMNIYGDYGNVLTLVRRLEWHGYSPIVTEYNVGDTLPGDIDIVIGGGGQDSGQDRIHSDLIKIGPKLKALAENGTPMLMVCGLYQLFGHFFETSAKNALPASGYSTAKRSRRQKGSLVTLSPPHLTLMKLSATKITAAKPSLEQPQHRLQPSSEEQAITLVMHMKVSDIRTLSERTYTGHSFRRILALPTF